MNNHDKEEIRQTLAIKKKLAEPKKTYEYGLLVGTKRERQYWRTEITDKIEELKIQYEDYEIKWEKAGMKKEHPYFVYLILIEAEIDILRKLLKEE